MSHTDLPDNYPFELTGETKIGLHGATLHRIRATRDLPYHGVKAGTVGGWVESLLLEDGSPRIGEYAWVGGYAQVVNQGQVGGRSRIGGYAVVAGNAQVYGNGWVGGSAKVADNARVDGSARVDGWAQVGDHAKVGGNALVGGSAKVGGYTKVGGNAQIGGSAQIGDYAVVAGNAKVGDYAEVGDYAVVAGNAKVGDHAKVDGWAQVGDHAQVGGNAKVGGNARVDGSAQVGGDAEIFETWHCLVVGPIGSEGVTATLARTKDGGHRLSVGCWEDGTLGTLMAEVKRRRERWTADEATKEVWFDEYRALKKLGKVTAKRWTKPEAGA